MGVLKPVRHNSKRAIPCDTPRFYNTLANGTNSSNPHLQMQDVRADRPVTAKGEPLEIRSKKSDLVLAATSRFWLVYLFDDNMLVDNTDLTKKPARVPKSLSLVLEQRAL